MRLETKEKIDALLPIPFFALPNRGAQSRINADGSVVGADRNPKIHDLSMLLSLSDWRAGGAGRLKPSA